MKQYPSRKSPRIPAYDYATPGYYFVTICTHEKQCIFGTTEKLNDLGELVKSELLAVPKFYNGVRIDQYVVMPNHIHAIIVLEPVPNLPKLDNVVCAFKAGVTRKAKKPFTIWQRSFHDHAIRSQAEYEKIWIYVKYNAQKWSDDCYFPADEP